MTYQTLQKKYPVFEYKGFKWEKNGNLITASWNFVMGDITFNPKIEISANFSILELEKSEMDNFVFHLGLAEIPSYWKATISPTIKISCGTLSKDQIKWWQDLLTTGMGQFYYENKLEVNVPALETSGPTFKKSKSVGTKTLIPISGGKDSAVVASVLKDKMPVVAFILNPLKNPSSLRVFNKTGIKEKVEVKREIDQKLLELNKSGFLNGHTPIMAYLSFLSVLCSAIASCKNIAFGNERSANEGGVTYLGKTINHQYDKSFEFEKKFREYNKSNLSAVNYFSLLRPLYEIQIAKLFSRYPQYFNLFLSCNVGAKDDRWCGQCPKCYAIYTLLRPFVNADVLRAVFGKDLETNNSTMRQLLGLEGEKPLECVGTVVETRLAYWLANKTHEFSKPEEAILTSWDVNNFLQENFVTILKAAYEKTKLNKKKILILGYAREGKSVHNFLKKYYPDSTVTIWDQKEVEGAIKVGDWKMIKDWNNFDLIVKSAGIPLKNLPDVIIPRLTSETQLFFDFCPGEIIGVTGTKGKSTTTALIYEILKTAGKKVVMVGNIGLPALDYLDEITEDTLVVFELSSHQLQTLRTSPHVAVLTNIYPEHLDYYTDFVDYAKAKANITKFQTKDDYFVYNKNYSVESKAIKMPFDKDTTIKSNLLGDHNHYNLAAAIKVSEIYHVREDVAKTAIGNFQPLAHRLEFVGKYKNLNFYNDSLATIPEATIGAIEALGDEVDTIVLGGFDRGIDFTLLAKKILETKIKKLILFPTTGQKIWEKTVEIDPSAVKRFKIFNAQNMQGAVEKAYEVTSPTKIVLLSCASTSFNLFKDYADRGQQFKDWVVKLGQIS